MRNRHICPCIYMHIWPKVQTVTHAFLFALRTTQIMLIIWLISRNTKQRKHNSEQFRYKWKRSRETLPEYLDLRNETIISPLRKYLMKIRHNLQITCCTTSCNIWILSVLLNYLVLLLQEGALKGSFFKMFHENQ